MKIENSLLKVSLNVIIFIMLSATVRAQNVLVSGEVKDSKGQSLSGASISVKGTKMALVSDQNGRFKINVPKNATVLIVSHSV